MGFLMPVAQGSEAPDELFYTPGVRLQLWKTRTLARPLHPLAASSLVGQLDQSRLVSKRQQHNTMLCFADRRAATGA
jgi:hypothetical protein